MKLKYPIEIISYPHYKLRMNLDDLLTKHSDLLVVRCIEGRPEEYMQKLDDEMIISSKIFKHNTANLSMNLAGGIFDTKCDAHLKFLPAIKEACETWNGGSISPDLYNREECYHIYETCFGLCFLVRNIHNRTFPFYKHFESKEERDNYEKRTLAAVTQNEMNYDAHFVEEFKNKKENVLVKPRIKVHHVPTKINYWHMTLDTYRPTDSDFVHPDEKQNNSDKSMFKALKQDLLQCYQINSMPEYTIESCDYTL